MKSNAAIGISKLVTARELESWRTVWLNVSGPAREIPLAAFIRHPDLFVFSPADRLANISSAEFSEGDATC